MSRILITIMKKTFLLVVIVTFFLSGCVSFPGGEIRALVEKPIGGEGKDKILLIDISGVITNKERTVLGLWKRPTITSRIKEELTKARGDSRIKAVVLRINSPGGGVTVCDIIRHEIEQFKEETGIVVIAEFMGVAASGGYYIATAADAIMAHPTTITGGVGVIAFLLNASGLMEKLGIRDETITSGDKKDIASPLRPMTDEERALLKGVVDSLFERFMGAVKEARPAMDEASLAEVADGRIFSAARALEIGLIDSIGYMDDAVELARKEAGISEATLITYARPAAYKENVYSLSPGGFAGEARGDINLINIDARELMGLLSPGFSYLWAP